MNLPGGEDLEISGLSSSLFGHVRGSQSGSVAGPKVVGLKRLGKTKILVLLGHSKKKGNKQCEGDHGNVGRKTGEENQRGLSDPGPTWGESRKKWDYTPGWRKIKTGSFRSNVHP